MTYIPRSSSAIPPSAGPIPKMVQKKRTLRIFNVIATILFVAAVVSAGGVYFLSSYAEKRLMEAKSALTLASDEEDERRIAQIAAFEARLSVGSDLLENHLAPSRLFEALEALTNEPVQLTTLSYEYEPGFEANLSLTAETDELTSIALQRIGLVASPLFTEFLMSEIVMVQPTEEEAGPARVEASFTGILDVSQIAYNPSVTREPGEGSQLPPVGGAEVSEVPDDAVIE